MEKDVVCGMQVDPAKAAGMSEYRGKTYYFCSAACKAQVRRKSEPVLTIVGAGSAGHCGFRGGRIPLRVSGCYGPSRLTKTWVCQKCRSGWRGSLT